MEIRSIKIFITMVAVAVIGVRIYKPEITLDVTIITLVVLAVLPWLSPLIKSFEGFGIKVEFHDSERTPPKGPLQDVSSEASIANRDTTMQSLNADLYLVKLVKLTPVEIVIVFILTNAMVASTTFTSMIWANFLILVVMTPAFLWRVVGVNKIDQLIASTLVFISWVFALGGPFSIFDWYSQLIGALVLAIVTLIAPLFRYKF